MEADERPQSAAHVAAVRMVLRPDVVRQLLRGCDLGGMDAAHGLQLQRQRRFYSLDPAYIALCPVHPLDCCVHRDVSYRVPVLERGQADGA